MGSDRFRRGIKRGAAVAGALTILAVLPAVFVLRTDPGRALLAGVIASALSVPGEREIAIGRLDGALPGEIVLSGVTIRDRKGVWFTAGSTRIEWRPWALAGRRWVVDLLTVDGLRIERSPGDNAAKATQLPRDLSLPTLPLGIRLSAFTLENVELGPELLGQPVALRAAGRFGGESNGDIRGSVRIERTDGIAGRATLAALLEHATHTLDIDLTMAEPPGGLVARSLDLPTLPAVSLTLKGRGPASAWRGRLVAEAKNLGSLNADVTLRLAARSSLGLVGGAKLGRWRVPGLDDLAGPTPQFDILVSLDGRRDLLVERALVRGRSVVANLRGRLDLGSLETDLALDAQFSDPTVVARFIAGLGIRSGELTATLRGPLDRLAVTATAAFGGVTAKGVGVERIEGRVVTTLGPRQVSAATTATLTGISAGPGRPVLPSRLDGTAKAVFDLARQTVALSEVRVAGKDLALTGNGRIDLERKRVGLDARVVVEKLAPWVGVFGLDLDGRADATLAMASAAQGGAASGRIELRLEELRSATLPLKATLGSMARLSARFEGASPDGVDVSRFSLTGANLIASGKAHVGAAWSTLDMTVSARGHDLAAWREFSGLALRGRARASARVTGALADPDARIELDFDAVSMETVGPLGGRVAVQAGTLVSAPSGSVSASLSGAGGPVDGGARFSMRQSPRLSLQDIRLSGFGGRAAGNLVLDLASGRAAGAIDVTIDDLAATGALAGVPVRGAAKARLSLADAQGGQTGSLSLNAPSLALTRPDGTLVELKGVSASAALKGLAPQASGRADFAIAGLTAGDLSLKELSLELSGTSTRFSFDLKGEGKWAAAFDVVGIGSAGRTGDGWSVTLDRLGGSAAAQKFALLQPATVTVTARGMSISSTAMRIGEGRVQGEGTLVRGRVSARLELAQVPLALAALAWDGPEVAGRVSATATLEGDPENPTGTAELHLTDISSGGLHRTDRVSLRGDASARLDARRLRVNADIGGFSQKGLTLEGEAPLRLALRPFAVSLPPEGALNATLKWQGEVSTLWEMLPLDEHRLSGAAEVSAVAAGTIAEPSVTGHVRLTGGRYENLSIGTVIDKLSVSADVDSGRMLSVEMTGTDGGTGRISGKGGVSLAPTADFPTRLDLSFADSKLIRRDEITATANGKLSLSGNLSALSLTGRVETKSIEARLDESLPPTIVELDVTDAPAAGARSVVENPRAKSAALTLDLDLVVPGQAFVRGRGLDSEWRGRLHVSGDAAAPVIEGKLSFIRGQFAFAGRRFTLEDSTLSFDGGARPDPLLDIRAANRAAGITALILITGRASDPKIALTSTPTLPQDEILSRVLFSKGAGALSPLEALQLAAAVAQLSGGGLKGAGILGKVRETLGVDVLDVGTPTDGSDGTTLRAGRHVNERTFVGVTQGSAPNSTGVTVEVELLPNVVVDTQSDQSGANKSSIKWKWDY